MRGRKRREWERGMEICLFKEVITVSFHAALGPCLWTAQADTNGPHQYCASSCCQSQTTLPVLSRRGQASQVLGLGVQQGGCGYTGGVAVGVGYVSVPY